ncbi:hypothetical protein NMY22_g9434 [Coprinellus aureogranulatus]|nr:hypothetical protein NMY22_g9434 [Coprinellus aureogranulatus]
MAIPNLVDAAPQTFHAHHSIPLPALLPDGASTADLHPVLQIGAAPLSMTWDARTPLHHDTAPSGGVVLDAAYLLTRSMTTDYYRDSMAGHSGGMVMFVAWHSTNALRVWLRIGWNGRLPTHHALAETSLALSDIGSHSSVPIPPLHRLDCEPGPRPQPPELNPKSSPDTNEVNSAKARFPVESGASLLCPSLSPFAQYMVAIVVNAHCSLACCAPSTCPTQYIIIKGSWVVGIFRASRLRGHPQSPFKINLDPKFGWSSASILWMDWVSGICPFPSILPPSLSCLSLSRPWTLTSLNAELAVYSSPSRVLSTPGAVRHVPLTGTQKIHPQLCRGIQSYFVANYLQELNTMTTDLCLRYVSRGYAARALPFISKPRMVFTDEAGPMPPLQCDMQKDYPPCIRQPSLHWDSKGAIPGRKYIVTLTSPCRRLFPRNTNNHPPLKMAHGLLRIPDTPSEYPIPFNHIKGSRLRIGVEPWYELAEESIGRRLDTRPQRSAVHDRLGMLGLHEFCNLGRLERGLDKRPSNRTRTHAHRTPPLTPSTSPLAPRRSPRLIVVPAGPTPHRHSKIALNGAYLIRYRSVVGGCDCEARATTLVCPQLQPNMLLRRAAEFALGVTNRTLASTKACRMDTLPRRSYVGVEDLLNEVVSQTCIYDGLRMLTLGLAPPVLANAFDNLSVGPFPRTRSILALTIFALAYLQEQGSIPSLRSKGRMREYYDVPREETAGWRVAWLGTKRYRVSAKQGGAIVPLPRLSLRCPSPPCSLAPPYPFLLRLLFLLSISRTCLHSVPTGRRERAGVRAFLRWERRGDLRARILETPILPIVVWTSIVPFNPFSDPQPLALPYRFPGPWPLPSTLQAFVCEVPCPTRSRILRYRVQTNASSALRCLERWRSATAPSSRCLEAWTTASPPKSTSAGLAGPLRFLVACTPSLPSSPFSLPFALSGLRARDVMVLGGETTDPSPPETTLEASCKPTGDRVQGCVRRCGRGCRNAFRWGTMTDERGRGQWTGRRGMEERGEDVVKRQEATPRASRPVVIPTIESPTPPSGSPSPPRAASAAPAMFMSTPPKKPNSPPPPDAPNANPSARSSGEESRWLLPPDFSYAGGHPAMTPMLVRTATNGTTPTIGVEPPSHSPTTEGDSSRAYDSGLLTPAGTVAHHEPEPEEHEHQELTTDTTPQSYVYQAPMPTPIYGQPTNPNVAPWDYASPPQGQPPQYQRYDHSQTSWGNLGPTGSDSWVPPPVVPLSPIPGSDYKFAASSTAGSPRVVSPGSEKGTLNFGVFGMGSATTPKFMSPAPLNRPISLFSDSDVNAFGGLLNSMMSMPAAYAFHVPNMRLLSQRRSVMNEVSPQIPAVLLHSLQFHLCAGFRSSAFELNMSKYQVPGCGVLSTGSLTYYHLARLDIVHGTQKRPGDRDEGHRNGSTPKRSRKESPVADWRDVHLKERSERSSRSEYDRKGSYKRDSRRYSRDRDRDRSRDHRRDRERRRSRSRTRERERSRSKSAAVVAVPDDDEKEEGEISPRPQDMKSGSKDVEMGDAQAAGTEPEPEPEPEQEKSIEEIMEERRRKRAAILAKHASGQASVPPQTPSMVVGDALAKISVKDGSVPPSGAPSKSQRDSASPPPPTSGIDDGFALAKEDEEDKQRQCIGAP